MTASPQERAESPAPTDGSGPGRIVCITGTGTGVGKTVVTAAWAALARRSGARVAVVKPAQTGTGEVGDGDSDAAVIRRLSGLDPEAVRQLAGYPEPLAPATAARRAGLPPLTLARTATMVLELAGSHDLVLVEGAGGLLVAFDDPPRAWTLADLAAELDLPALVVTTPGLGTLNHTALTLEALVGRGITPLGVVIGAWPEAPDLAERCNLTDLQHHAGARLLGALPAGLAALPPAEFAAAAAVGLAPLLGGTFDGADFTAGNAPAPRGATASTSGRPSRPSTAPEPKASE